MYMVMAVALLSLGPNQQHDAFALASSNVQKYNDQEGRYIRYLWIGHLPEKERQDMVKVLSFHCNQLSTEADLVIPQEVSPGLLQIDIRNYGWTLELWERLAGVDPYFTETVVEETSTITKEYWPGGYEDGKYWQAGYYDIRRRKKKEIRAIAGWLTDTQEKHNAARSLADITYSRLPVAMGDWFLWQTAIQSDRGKAGYYDFVGVEDRNGLEKLVGFDQKLAEGAKRIELLDAVSVSTVTHQPRRVGAFPAVSGWYWKTFDSRRAVDEKNPLRILGEGFQHEAEEVFGHLPNNLMVWGLFDAAGKRQDFAPDFIASDSTANGTDRRVHAGLSCIRCHLPSDGINDIDAWARGLYGPGTGMALLSPDYEKQKKLRQQYLRDLGGAVEDSRRVYARAIAQCTGGMKPAELGKVYAQAEATYSGPVDLARASRYIGMEHGEVKERLTVYLRSSGKVDTVLAGLIVGKKIRIEQWHEVYPEMQRAVRGLASPSEKKP